MDPIESKENSGVDVGVGFLFGNQEARVARGAVTIRRRRWLVSIYLAALRVLNWCWQPFMDEDDMTSSSSENLRG